MSGSTPNQRSYVHKKKCVYCGCKESLYFTIDHIVPLHRGGKDIHENMQTTCFACNSLKNGFDEDKFLAMMKGLRILAEQKIIKIQGSVKKVFNDK